MLVNIDNTYCKIHSDGAGLWVDAPGGEAIRADTLSPLIHRLESRYASVSLPINLFANEHNALDDLIKLGFERLDQNTLRIAGVHGTLKPFGYWSSKAGGARPQTDRKYFRLYQAEWADENGIKWAQIFTETELDLLDPRR